MEIKIIGANKIGDYESENITLEVVNDCVLDQYIIRTANHIGNKEENVLDHKWDHVFHFLTPISLKKGDKIIIFSKSNTVGTYHHRDISENNKEYIFYFNSETSIWDKHTGAIIFKLDSWEPVFSI